MNVKPLFDALDQNPARAAELARHLIAAYRLPMKDLLGWDSRVLADGSRVESIMLVPSKFATFGWWVEEVDALLACLVDLKASGAMDPDLLRQARELDRDHATVRRAVDHDEEAIARLLKKAREEDDWISAEEARREVQDRKRNTAGLAAA